MPSNGRSEGFESIHWRRWGDALGPSGSEEDFHGGLVLITEDSDRLVEAIHTRRGAVDPATVRFPCSLAQLAKDHRAWWVLQLEREEVRWLAQQPFATAEDQDHLDRLLALWNALGELQSERRLVSWPHRLDRWPVLVDLAPQGLAALVPEGHSAVTAIWKGDRLTTALAFRRKRGRIDRILGPGVLEPAMGLVSGDWTRDYRYLLQAVERELGPVGLGFFAQEGAARELSRQGNPAAWARAVAARDVIVSPMSSALAVQLGVDLGRAALRRARDFVSSRGLGGWIPPELGGLFESEARRPDLRDFLGLDAFRVLREASGGRAAESHGDSAASLAGGGE